MKTIKELKLDIADDKIDEALKELLSYSSEMDTELFNQIIVLKSQYKDFTIKENLNLNDTNIEKQKIVNGLLNIVDEIGEHINNVQLNREKTEITEGVLVKGSPIILSVLWANLYGFQIKNADLVMMTIHPDSPIYEGFRDYINQIFTHDIEYKLLSLVLDSKKDDDAYVRMVLESRTLHYDPTFKNNISTSMQILKKDKDGNWKLWTGEILELKYLEN